MPLTGHIPSAGRLGASEPLEAEERAVALGRSHVLAVGGVKVARGACIAARRAIRVEAVYAVGRLHELNDTPIAESKAT